MAGTKTAKAREKAPRPPQGAPPVLAGRVRDSAAPGENGVTRSGRCPDCGYLIGSPGHANTCGLRRLRRGGDTVETWTTARATSAGVYNALLGGKDNYAADRAAAGTAIEAYPFVRDTARNNRAFLGRAVTWATGQGISQFLDLGCGYPWPPDIHQSAGADTRTCYVDNDPVVVAHSLALHAAPGVTSHRADLRDADTILRECKDDGWDLAGPVCVIFGLVLQYFDAAEAEETVARYVSRLAPGSAVVVSCWACGDDSLAGRLADAHPAARLYRHGRAGIGAMLAGLDVEEPGIVRAPLWKPQRPAGMGERPVLILAGVGIKPR